MIRKLVNRLRLKETIQGQTIEFDVHDLDPYMVSLMKRQLKIAKIYNESIDKVIERIRMVEAITKSYVKATKLKKASVKITSKKDLDEAYKKLYRNIYNVVAKRLKVIVQRAKTLKSMTESDYDDVGDDLIGNNLDGIGDEILGTTAFSLTNAYTVAAGNIKAGFNISFDRSMFEQRASDYLRDRFYNKGVYFDIEQNMKDRIASKIADAFESGDSIDDITKGLSEDLLTDEDWAIERIARTELGNASTAGGIESAKDSGLDLVAWFNVSSDSCDDCQDVADGNPYELDEIEDLPHPNCRDSLDIIPRDAFEETGDEE